MKRHVKAEMWDKTQYLFRNYYDRMMHSVLYFDGLIDVEILKRALKFQIDNVTVLHSRYHNNPIKPYWTVEDYDIDDVVTVCDVEDAEAAIGEFVTQRIPIKKNVQLQIGVFNAKGKSVLVMVSNHMCFDGGDFKYFLTTLCTNYSKLYSGDENLTIKHGSRAYDMVYSSMNDEAKAHAKSLYRNISAVQDKHVFPLTPPRKDDKNMIVRHEISADRFGALRVEGKALGFTINDVMLAIYFRALYEVGGFDADESVSIQSMVDLRRHMKAGGLETGLTNHTGFMTCSIQGIGNTLRDTLVNVAEAMKENKADEFLGLYSLPLLSLAYTVFPHCISEFAIKCGYKNPLIGMSNIGMLKPEQYRMGELKLENCWYTGAVKYKPYMQLAFTTFEGAATFTVAIRGNEDDRKVINRFFDAIEKNVDELIQVKRNEKKD